MRLPVPTADTGKLIRAAMTLLGQLWRPGYRYMKAGVILLDLAPAASRPAFSNRPTPPSSDHSSRQRTATCPPGCPSAPLSPVFEDDLGEEVALVQGQAIGLMIGIIVVTAPCLSVFLLIRL